MTHLLGETFEICFKNIRATVALLQELARIHNSPRNINSGSCTTDCIPRVCHRLCKIGNNSEERKQSIYTLCQNIFSNYQVTIREISTNHISDSVWIYSCSVLVKCKKRVN